LGSSGHTQRVNQFYSVCFLFWIGGSVDRSGIAFAVIESMERRKPSHEEVSMLFVAGVIALLCCWATPLQADTDTALLPHGTNKGEITAVDTGSRTFTLIVGKQSIPMSYDDKTQFVELGHAVQPEAMTEGGKAKVQFVEYEPGKPTATKVDLKPGHHSKSVTTQAQR
jgi:hypothetical protein